MERGKIWQYVRNVCLYIAGILLIIVGYRSNAEFQKKGGKQALEQAESDSSGGVEGDSPESSSGSR